MKHLFAIGSILCWMVAGATSQPEIVWSGAGVNLLGAPSPDGRYLSFVDASTGNLAVRERKSGAVRMLTSNKPGSKEFAYFSVFSRDSQRVAYAWFNELGFYDLRVIGVDGTNEKILYRNEEAGFVQPCAWSPDDAQILTLLFRADNISQIVMMPSGGGAPKILRSLNWVYPKRMDLSPDGRFIAYDSFAKAGGGDRTVFLLSTSGDRETRLTSEPGNHLFPLWTPDGRSIVFLDEREGSTNASMVAMEGGKPAGAPRVLYTNVGRALPMGITAAGEYYVGVRSGETDVFVTRLASPAENPLRASIRFRGRNSAPAFSADGKLLAFLSRSGTENFGEDSRFIVVRAMDSTDERVLAPKLAHMEQVSWSPDGRRLLVSGSDGKGRGGLFSVDVGTGALRTVAATAGGPYKGYPAAWSTDGSVIYYIRDETEVRAHSLDTQTERTILRGAGLRHLAVSSTGHWLAVGTAAGQITLVRATGAQPRSLPFPGVTELQWGRELMAARGTDLYRIPLDGSAPVKIEMPGNRLPGFSVHPDGERVALTAGRNHSEVKMFRLPKASQ